MTRKVLVLVLAVAATMLPATARATHAYEHHENRRFTAPTPCGVVCPYWVADDEAACAPQPASVPASWDDLHLDLAAPADAGARIVFFDFKITPLVDFDAFICSRVPPYFLAQGTTPLDLCGIGGFGCEETAEIAVCTDARYPAERDRCVPDGWPVTLRAYNWSNGFPWVDATIGYSRGGVL